MAGQTRTCKRCTRFHQRWQLVLKNIGCQSSVHTILLKKSVNRFPSCCSGALTNNEHSFPLTFTAGELQDHVKFFLEEGHVEEGDCALGLQDQDAH